jgi:hypothetical protein
MSSERLSGYVMLVFKILKNAGENLLASASDDEWIVYTWSIECVDTIMYELYHRRRRIPSASSLNFEDSNFSSPPLPKFLPGPKIIFIYFASKMSVKQQRSL